MRSGHFLQQGDTWHGGSSGRHRSGSSRGGGARRKGNKLLSYLLLLLVIVLAAVILEVLRTYSGGKSWIDNIELPPESGAG